MVREEGRSFLLRPLSCGHSHSLKAQRPRRVFDSSIGGRARRFHQLSLRCLPKRLQVRLDGLLQQPSGPQAFVVVPFSPKLIGYFDGLRVFTRFGLALLASTFLCSCVLKRFASPLTIISMSGIFPSGPVSVPALRLMTSRSSRSNS